MTKEQSMALARASIAAREHFFSEASTRASREVAMEITVSIAKLLYLTHLGPQQP